MPASASMYHSVSMPSCCSPLESPPWLTTQMLNHVGLVILPCGFSAIRTSFRGIPARKFACANAFADKSPAAKLSRVTFMGGGFGVSQNRCDLVWGKWKRCYRSITKHQSIPGKWRQLSRNLIRMKQKFRVLARLYAMRFCRGVTGEQVLTM
jgi:hypothetical protein